MSISATTKMSSKGQIVIPEEIRKKYGFNPGAQFVVVGGKGVVVLKIISAPNLDEFEAFIKTARKQAKNAELKRSDIANAVKASRGRK